MSASATVSHRRPALLGRGCVGLADPGRHQDSCDSPQLALGFHSAPFQGSELKSLRFSLATASCALSARLRVDGIGGCESR